MQLKKYLSILLLLAPSLIQAVAPLVIDAPIVKATYGIIPLVKPEILLKRVQELLNRNYGNNDNIISLQEIVDHEDMFSQESHDKLVNGCINTLIMVLTQEPTPQDSYLKDFRMIQQYLEELITAWAQQRQCDIALLKVLIKIANSPHQEREILVDNIKSIRGYQRLLIDAEQFLTDFLHTYSAKKS